MPNRAHIGDYALQVVTPVRRSARRPHRPPASVAAILEETHFSYAPNPVAGTADPVLSPATKPHAAEGGHAAAGQEAPTANPAGVEAAVDGNVEGGTARPAHSGSTSALGAALQQLTMLSAGSTPAQDRPVHGPCAQEVQSAPTAASSPGDGKQLETAGYQSKQATHGTPTPTPAQSEQAAQGTPTPSSVSRRTTAAAVSQPPAPTPGRRVTRKSLAAAAVAAVHRGAAPAQGAAAVAERQLVAEVAPSETSVPGRIMTRRQMASLSAKSQV